MEPISRRDFLRNSAGAAAGLAAATSLLADGRAALAADAEVRIAVCGIHGRGGDHINGFMGVPGVRVVALCDPDESLWEPRAQAVIKTQGHKPKFYYDIRELLASKDIDAISVATPNHWHALATIWACQAGKDVYVEKPASWCVWEGRRMVEAARKYGRIVQVGTQSRSDGRWRTAVGKLHRGDIGELVMARATCYKPRPSIGFKPVADPPKHLHWDIWRGPGPNVPFHANLVHYNWHWFYDFGNGDLGNQGVHQMDIARWGLGKQLPVYVHGRGERLGYKDQGETPNTQVCQYEYDDGTQLVFEVRGLPTAEESGSGVGNQFYGSEGWMHEGDGLKVRLGYDGKETKTDDTKLPPVGGSGTGGHFHNFIQAVRSRRVEDLNSDVLEGHYSAALCHLGMISHRLRRALQFDPDTEQFAGDDEANEYLRRPLGPVVRDGAGLVTSPFRVPDQV